jgi:hypothetical protein
MWKAILIALPLAGCITTEDRGTIDAIVADNAVRGSGPFYSRGQIDAINAETACKAMARTLVQIARCEVRR